MKQVSANLVTTLSSATLICADLYKFGPFPDATYKYWTSGDAAISYSGQSYVKAGLQRGNLRNTTGTEIATLDVTIVPAAETVGGYGLVAAATIGLFDNVAVTISRSYSTTTYGAVADGVVPIFGGFVVDAQPGSSVLRLVLKSWLALSNVTTPRRRVQAACPYRVGDTQCGVTLSSFTHARTAAAGTTATTLVLSSSSTYAVVGSVVTMTSGTYSGLSRVVQAVSGVNLTLDYPLPGAPSIGNGIDVKRGCDKVTTTCDTVFSNLVNFGGMPTVPYKRS